MAKTDDAAAAAKPKRESKPTEYVVLRQVDMAKLQAEGKLLDSLPPEVRASLSGELWTPVEGTFEASSPQRACKLAGGEGEGATPGRHWAIPVSSAGKGNRLRVNAQQTLLVTYEQED